MGDELKAVSPGVCERCGSKTHITHTRPVSDTDFWWLIRRRHKCDACLHSFYSYDLREEDFLKLRRKAGLWEGWVTAHKPTDDEL